MMSQNKDWEILDIGHYSRVYLVNACDEKFDRLEKEILFLEMKNIVNKEKQIAIISKIVKVGVIYGQTQYVDKFIDKIEKENPHIKIHIVKLSTPNEYAKMSFSYGIKKQGWL